MKNKENTMQAQCKHHASAVQASEPYGDCTNGAHDQHIASPIPALFSAGGEVNHG